MAQLQTMACMSCIHFYGAEANAQAWCEAFPDGGGIPKAILYGYNPHTDVFPGDHGIRWELMEGKEQEHQQYINRLAREERDAALES